MVGAGIEEDIGLSHVHGGDQLPGVGTVINSDFSSRLQDLTLQYAVQINREELHALRKDQLKGVIKTKSVIMIMRNPSQCKVYPIPSPPTSLPHLSRRGGAGTVLSVTGQDLGTLSDESVANSLPWGLLGTPCMLDGKGDSIVTGQPLHHGCLPPITATQECWTAVHPLPHDPLLLASALLTKLGHVVDGVSVSQFRYRSAS